MSSDDGLIMGEVSDILKDDESRELLLRQRCAALLGLYTSGKLPERDKAELREYLGGYLPHEKPGVVAVPVAVTEVPSAAVALPRAPVVHSSRLASLLFRFAHQKGTGSEEAEIRALLPPLPNLLGHLTRASYKKPLAEYARALGYKSDQTLRRWIDDGRACDPPDLPPFDDPSQLAAWWGRTKKTPTGGVRKIPDELLALAAPAPVVSGAAPAASVAVSSAAGVPVVRSADFISGEGFEIALQRARQNERIAAETLEAARRAEDLVKIRASSDAWTKAFQDLTRAEMNANEILSTTGKLVSWESVEAEIRPRLEAMNQSLRAILVRVFTKVPVSEELASRLDDAYQGELDRVFVGSRAETPPTPAPLPPSSPPFALDRAA